MPSGKQILLSVLQEQSQQFCDTNDLDRVNDRIRAALLIHCSTADKTWPLVEKIGWLSSTSEDGEVCRQGLGFKESNIFLTDLFEVMSENESIPETVRRSFPDLSQKDYEDALSIMWYLLSSLQYWQELACVENNGDLDVAERDRLLGSLIRKLHLYRDDPQSFLGIDPNNDQ